MATAPAAPPKGRYRITVTYINGTKEVFHSDTKVGWSGQEPAVTIGYAAVGDRTSVGGVLIPMHRIHRLETIDTEPPARPGAKGPEIPKPPTPPILFDH